MLILFTRLIAKYEIQVERRIEKAVWLQEADKTAKYYFCDMAKNRLFQQAVGDPLLLSNRQQISRDIPLVNNRNFKMISRYYVYTVLMKVPAEQALMELKREYFLKEKIIKKIIDSRQPEFDEMSKEKRQLDWFKVLEGCSHINWDYNPLSS